MRRMILSLALSVAFASAAFAQPISAQAASLTPPAFAEADIIPDAQAAQATRILQQLHKQLELAGYRDVQIIPQAVVVSAKDHKGNPALLLVDTESLTALQLEPPGTGPTGSKPDNGGER